MTDQITQTTADRIVVLREYMRLIEIEISEGKIPPRLIDTAHNMLTLIEEASRDELARTLRASNSPKTKMNSLSPQEQRVALFVKQGDQNREIAERLNIGEATVKVHMKAISRKLGVTNRTQIAIAVHEHLLGSVIDSASEAGR